MPRYVVLEHRWDGVHWDFMLEADGRLRTWAIDAPIVPGADLPARALADHRLAYLDWEGPVSGGRGTVSRTDRGTYTARVWTATRVEVELAGGQLVGAVGLWTEEVGGPGASAGWVFRLGKVD
jgi:hypothetical protein